MTYNLFLTRRIHSLIAVVAAAVIMGILSPTFAQQNAATPHHQTISDSILAGARAEAEKATPYIMNYEILKYPGGDVSEDTGVCTDLIVRAFRHAGIDLQKEVHEDMQERPAAYPKIWDSKKIDRNIDHRRCPNLVVWLKKNATELGTGTDAASLSKNWKPGDVVFFTRDRASYPWHVAIVSDRVDGDGMPFIIDAFPPKTSESHRLDDFAPIGSHFRMSER